MKRITFTFVGSILTMACSGTPLAPIRDSTGSQQVSSATSVLPTPSVLGKPMPSALAETTGDTTTFLVSAGISLTAGAANTIARYIGHPIGTARIQGCAADNAEYPVQVLLLVDPGSGTRAFQIEVITPSSTTPVPDGTSLTNLSLSNSCTVPATGAQYDEYTATLR